MIGKDRRPCLCGCRETPVTKKARYCVGHDAQVAPKVEVFLDEEGLLDLKELFDRYRELSRRGA